MKIAPKCEARRYSICSKCGDDKLPVFPKAQGFGIYTPAGRYGKVYRVTNLNNRGTGSLRDAMEASARRVVIFEVSGTIWLNSNIVVKEPYLTVAGQTAPSPGITLARAGIVVSAHDVLIQHLLVRVGDLPVGTKPDFRDCIQVVGAADGQREVYNVVIDHCSVS